MDIIESLKNKFQQEKVKKGRAIVFWYDTAMQVPMDTLQEALQVQEITIKELSEHNFFTTKVELELNYPNQSYLLYAPFPRPKDQENYLLDVLLYSAEFKADEVAVLAERLSIKDHVLRPMMEQYPLFFRSEDRKQKLCRLLLKEADERQMAIAMLAVITGTSTASVSRITRDLLLAGIVKNENKSFQSIEKYFSLDRMYELLQQNFGVSIEQQVEPFVYLLELFLYQHFKRDSILPSESLDEEYSSSLPNVCALLVDDWMRASQKEVLVLEQYIKEVESKLQIRSLLHEVDINQFDLATTFPVIDLALIEKLMDELTHQVSNLSDWKKRLQQRRESFWGKKDKVNKLYCVLIEAVHLMEQMPLVKQYDSGSELYGQYANNLHLIDQSYRRFMYNYTKLEAREMVEQLALTLTNWYENVFLLKMAHESNQIVENNETSRIPKQRFFFSSTIQPILEKEQTRVFVIISDALRYEAGSELSQSLNKRVNGQATVSPLVASLPSYTQLGMASLLPNRNLTIKDKIVYSDKQATNGLSNRTKILQKAHPDSIAYHLNDLLDWNRQEAEEKLKGKRLVYLYHDVIDAIGDSKKSERETYEAVSKALETLELAVDRLSRLQAKRIFITSDHGFLFQLTKVEVDAKVQAVTGNVIEQSRRFSVGNSLTVPEGAMKLSDSQTPLKDVEVVLAKGVNRFKTGGGLQFIHGGAMPQEVIIPLIDYRRTERAEKVDISVAMIDKTITNFRISVSFYQEQSVSTDYSPRQVKIAFYQDDERISNEAFLTFDLSGGTQDRNETITFTLAERYYHIGETCQLRIETVEATKTKLYKEERFTLRMYDALY